MQMMQLFAQRGGVPRAVFKDARIGDIDCILKYTINALTWDDFRLVCRPDNLKDSDKIAKVHPPHWEEGRKFCA